MLPLKNKAPCKMWRVAIAHPPLCIHCLSFPYSNRPTGAAYFCLCSLGADTGSDEMSHPLMEPACAYRSPEPGSMGKRSPVHCFRIIPWSVPINPRRLKITPTPLSPTIHRPFLRTRSSPLQESSFLNEERRQWNPDKSDVSEANRTQMFDGLWFKRRGSASALSRIVAARTEQIAPGWKS